MHSMSTHLIFKKIEWMFIYIFICSENIYLSLTDKISAVVTNIYVKA